MRRIDALLDGLHTTRTRLDGLIEALERLKVAPRDEAVQSAVVLALKEQAEAWGRVAALLREVGEELAGQGMN